MGFQQVRRAVRVEVPRLADTLQAAFDGYPWTDWAFPANERAERVGDCFALYLAASITGQGEVWTTDNQACVAMVAVGTALAQTGTAWGNLARTNGSTCSPNRSASSRCG